MTVRGLFKRVLRPFRPGIEAARRSVLGLPPVGQVDFGDLRRLAPISRKFGVDRGLPIDRFYVEHFLDSHGDDIRGHVLEIGEDTYTRRFGGPRVMASDVLHVSADNPAATIVADLADAPQIPDDRFDAIILTQTLQLIFDPPAAIRTLHRILKPGGTLLVTVPGISPVATDSVWGPTWHWSFTENSIRRLIGTRFEPAHCRFETHGNVLAAVAFLEGLAAEDLRQEELTTADRDYPVIITAWARKSGIGTSAEAGLPWVR